MAEKKGFSENISRFYFKQMVECVGYLHDQEICHRDLKLENFVLKNFSNIKLIDFGFCNKYNPSNSKLVILN